MATYTVTTDPTQDDTIAAALADPAIRAKLASQPKYTLDAPGLVQAMFDGSGMFEMVQRRIALLQRQRLATLEANPDLLAQVDALTTPVALKP